MIIEECGSGGTSLGKFTRRKDVAWITWSEDNRIATLTSVRTHEPLAEIDVAYMSVSYADNGEYIGKGNDWHHAVRLALGSHSYGYSWYQVKGHARGYVPSHAR